MHRLMEIFYNTVFRLPSSLDMLLSKTLSYSLLNHLSSKKVGVEIVFFLFKWSQTAPCKQPRVTTKACNHGAWSIAKEMAAKLSVALETSRSFSVSTQERCPNFTQPCYF